MNHASSAPRAWSTTPTRVVRAALAAALCTVAAGCGADLAGAGNGGFTLSGDVATGSDVWLPAVDAGPQDVGSGTDAGLDAASTDTTPPADTGRDAAGKTDSPAPPAGPTRLSLALDGERAAWVEVAPDGGRTLVVWTLSQPDLPPTPYPWPYLVQPRDLQLTDGWLVFVDEPYNDPDVFALRLSDGAVLPVVTRPGAQEHPALLATPDGTPFVAWQDCRACVAGAPPSPAVYLRALPHGAESPISAPGVGNTLPTGGSLTDGSPALAWVVDGSAARVWSPGDTAGAPPAVDLTIPLPFSQAAGVALTRGVLASRPSPLIINPDSMTPSDVFLTALASGQTRRVSTHAELDATTPPAPVARGGRVAWLESRVGDPPHTQRLVVVDVTEFTGSLADAPADTLLAEDLQGVSALALSDDWVGAIAIPEGPAATSDVWLQELP